MTTLGGDSLPPAQAAKTRALVTLVLDTSDSMSGSIHRLNTALDEWRRNLEKMNQLRRFGEIAIVTFGLNGVRVLDPTGRLDSEPAQAFVSIDAFSAPTLRTGGYSPMVEAVHRALSITDKREAELRERGIGSACRPMIFLVTDGAPTELDGRPTQRWRELAREIQQREEIRRLVFYAFGVPGANTLVLEALARSGGYQSLDRADFLSILRSVSESIGRNLQSREPKKDLGITEDKRRRIHDMLNSPDSG